MKKDLYENLVYRTIVEIYYRSITNAVLWLATPLTIYSVVDSE